MDLQKAIATISLTLSPVLLGIILSKQIEQHDMIVRLDEWREIKESEDAIVKAEQIELRGRTDDRYRRADAMKDFGEVYKKIHDIEVELAKCCKEKAP